MSQEARGINLSGHIGEFELYGLKLRDGLTKLLALFRVMQSSLVRALRHSNGQSCNADSASVEDLQRIDESAAGFTKEVLFWHSAVFENDRGRIARPQSEFVFFFAGREARHSFFKNECGDS